jgi:hypothetical protein
MQRFNGGSFAGILFVCMSALMQHSALAATFHSHTTLNSCVLTIGNFCPVESIGASVLSTVVLTLIIGGITFGFRRLADGPPKPTKDQLNDCVTLPEEQWRARVENNPRTPVPELVQSFLEHAVSTLRELSFLQQAPSVKLYSLGVAIIKHAMTHDPDSIDRAVANLVTSAKKGN